MKKFLIIFNFLKNNFKQKNMNFFNKEITIENNKEIKNINKTE